MRELLNEIGLTEDEIKQFDKLEKEGKYREQERMLRHRRNIILDTIHDGEKLLGNLDYLLFTITKKSIIKEIQK